MAGIVASLFGGRQSEYEVLEMTRSGGHRLLSLNGECGLWL